MTGMVESSRAPTTTYEGGLQYVWQQVTYSAHQAVLNALRRCFTDAGCAVTIDVHQGLTGSLRVDLCVRQGSMILRKCLRDPPDQRITDQDHGSKDQADRPSLMHQCQRRIHRSSDHITYQLSRGRFCRITVGHTRGTLWRHEIINISFLLCVARK